MSQVLAVMAKLFTYIRAHALEHTTHTRRERKSSHTFVKKQSLHLTCSLKLLKGVCVHAVIFTPLNGHLRWQWDRWDVGWPCLPLTLSLSNTHSSSSTCASFFLFSYCFHHSHLLLCWCLMLKILCGINNLEIRSYR